MASIHEHVYTVVSKVQRWGNSYGIRLRKGDLRALGLKEGALVDVEVRPHRPAQALDLSDLPTFHDPDPLASIHHDEYLYGPEAAEKKKR